MRLAGSQKSKDSFGFGDCCQSSSMREEKETLGMSILRRSRKGFTLIELLIVIAVIAILAAIAIPNLLSSRKSANEASAIGSVRTINSAEATYRSRNTTYGSLPQLASTSLVDPSLGAATATAAAKSGFIFNIAGTSVSTYYVTGTPVTSSGDRQFYTDESGVIFAAPTATTLPAADTSGIAPSGFAQIGN
jgi:type IV pilus assembly protein PilA